MTFLSPHEVFIIQTAIDNILHEFSNVDELETRTGFTRKEYEEVRKCVNHPEALSKENLIVVNQALNEVCNGYYIENFNSVFNAEKTEVKALLKRIQLEYAQTHPL